MDGTPLETSAKQVNRLRVPPLGLTLAVLAGAFLCYAPAAQSQAPAVPATGQQVVLVTGSTSGLGREVALRLGGKGAHVIVHGRDQERGMQVVDEINRAVYVDRLDLNKTILTFDNFDKTIWENTI